MSDETVDFSYRKTRRVDRDDWFGRLASWIGDHPIGGGFIGGLGVVAIAIAAVPGAIASAPMEVGVLSGLVVVVWVVLFYLMGDFFGRMGETEIEETYHVEADEERFEWRRGDQVLAQLEDPTYELFAASEIDEEAKRGEAVPVYLVIRGEGGEFVLETNVTADEAGEYRVREEAGEPDETLPVHLASSLLQRAR